MPERVKYQIGNILQVYYGRIGTVVYTHDKTDSPFPNDQQVWNQCPNGSIIDAVAEYFRTAIGSSKSDLQ